MSNWLMSQKEYNKDLLGVEMRIKTPLEIFYKNYKCFMYYVHFHIPLQK